VESITPAIGTTTPVSHDANSDFSECGPEGVSLTSIGKNPGESRAKCVLRPLLNNDIISKGD